jgi:hypothetical protein
VTAPKPRLRDVEARAEEATEGPWVQNGINGVHTPVGSCVALSYRHDDTERKANAQFIAASRTDVPAMAAAIRAVLALTIWNGIEVHPSKRVTVGEIRAAINAHIDTTGSDT